jgi:hypothetical protein
MDRSCLHCALARALSAETDAFAAHGVSVSFTRSEPVWLPSSGMRLYRGVRRLLRQARAETEAREVKLAVIDLAGKSHVEVTATVTAGRGARVLACAFPRHVPGSLSRGFAEAIELR